MVVGVAAVQLIEHLSDSSVQPGLKEPYILLFAQVQYAVDAFCQMQFDVWSQSDLEEQRQERNRKLLRFMIWNAFFYFTNLIKLSWLL